MSSRSKYRASPGNLAITPLLGVLLVVLVLVAITLIFAGHAEAAVLTASAYCPVRYRDIEQLVADAQPQGATSNTVRGVLWDMQLFTSGSTTKLNFFTAIQTDPTLGNCPGNGGILPDGYGIAPNYITVDILTRATVSGANTAVGAYDDIQQLLQRGVMNMRVGSTSMPSTPLSFLHCSGGAIGSLAASLTAPQGLQGGNNGQQDGGWNVTDSFIITPQNPFKFSIEWNAAITLLSGNIYFRASLEGDYTQPVG